MPAESERPPVRALQAVASPHESARVVRAVVRDAAKQAARDERDRLGCHASDYAVGRMVEAAIAVVLGERFLPDDRRPWIDCPSREAAE